MARRMTTMKRTSTRSRLPPIGRLFKICEMVMEEVVESCDIQVAAPGFRGGGGHIRIAMEEQQQPHKLEV